MSSPEDIRRRALGRYPEFLRSIVNGSAFFPLPIRFGKPSATEDFQKLRNEITTLTNSDLGCRIEWMEVNSRRWGKQRLPERVEFSDEASFLRAVGKVEEVARFRENVDLTCKECPALIHFIEAHPLETVEFGDSWKGLVDVCCYLRSHPRPNLYARELPVAVDTKFIERHQSILSRLLPVVLPPEAMVEADRFEERFGIRFDEPLIRLRLLDESLMGALSVAFPDLAIPLSRFRELNWQSLRVVVSENKMTFLTLPSLSNGIAVWGAGNAAALLHGVRWLSDCQILYWGDLDTQGLQILSRLRAVFPHVRSLMMDLDAMSGFEHLCVSGTPSKSPAPPNLAASELAAWSMIQSRNLRLEQERLPPGLIREAIRGAF